MKKILCTCPPMIAAIDRYLDEFKKRDSDVFCPEFQQEMPEDELIKLIPKYDGWIIGDCPASDQVLSTGKAGSLKAAVRWGIGTNNVDFIAAKRLGYTIHNTPGVFNEEVSDVALGYAIGLVRDLFTIDRGVKNGQWPKPAGRSFSKLHVGVVGYGNIGKATCRKFSGLGCKVSFSDPFFSGKAEVGHHQTDWPEIMTDIDILVITCALTDSNYHMLSTAELKLAKQGLQIVNVARGPLIDESALIHSLETGKVVKAALDVFEDEPLAMDNPLRKYEEVIFGSHNGSNTIDAVDRTSMQAIELLFREL